MLVVTILQKTFLAIMPLSVVFNCNNEEVVLYKNQHISIVLLLIEKECVPLFFLIQERA